MKLKKLAVGLLITPVLLLSIFVFLFDGFLETVDIEPNSVRSWFTVPDLLKSDELEQFGRIEKYKYWPADNSSESTEVYISAYGKKELIERRVQEFFAQNGFVKGQYSWMGYVKGNESLSFSLEEKSNNEWLLVISLSY